MNLSERTPRSYSLITLLGGVVSLVFGVLVMNWLNRSLSGKLLSPETYQMLFVLPSLLIVSGFMLLITALVSLRVNISKKHGEYVLAASVGITLISWSVDVFNSNPSPLSGFIAVTALFVAATILGRTFCWR